MIGNDLVDLRQAALDSNWRRKGYLQKIYSPQEQVLILNSPLPSSMLWLIWSMKEASYKIVNRETGLRRYNPLDFTCTELFRNELEATGTINYQQSTYYLKSNINAQMIHSVAVSQKKDFADLTFIQLNPSKTYMEDFNSLSVSYQLSKTKSGIPQVTHTLTGRSHAASLSHHGRYLVIVYSGSPLLTD